MTLIAPLAMFRVLFGFIMCVSVIRFAAKGWIHDLYIAPVYHFTFYGFDWVQPLGGAGMYVVFLLMGLSSLFIMLGWYYRWAAALFFALFTYVELIDKTNYLNHYYFVSIIAFLLIWVPANRYFSLDVARKPALQVETVPAWTINIFKLQLGIVYFYAGLAKINTDWLFDALPLRIWLPALSHLPFIGHFLALPETAYLFSWAGAFYDLTIVFFLLYQPTRPWAYAAVVVFHMATSLFFQIGMFPYIMILSTSIYCSASFHQRIISTLKRAASRWIVQLEATNIKANPGGYTLSRSASRWTAGVLAVHFMLQMALPLRSALYPGSLFWTEQGYRFSWRVMLMEKAGYVVFRVQHPASGASWEVANWDYLTPNQEKMMATQPDMILQFAHFLQREYQKQGMEGVQITADAFVSLNGRRSRRYVNPAVDLTHIKPGLAPINWILPYPENE